VCEFYLHCMGVISMLLLQIYHCRAIATPQTRTAGNAKRKCIVLSLIQIGL
jgi:hypothetical protein